MPSEAGHRRKFNNPGWHGGRRRTSLLEDICRYPKKQQKISFNSLIYGQMLTSPSSLCQVSNTRSSSERRNPYLREALVAIGAPSIGNRGTETWEAQSLTELSNRGRHLSYQRGKRNTNPNTSLIQIEGVNDTTGAKYVDIRERL